MITCEEWSREFDLLWNNIMSNQAPGLTEYEKSLFLTQSQEAVVISLYNGSAGESFEETEELTTYLAPLVKQVTLTETTDKYHIVDGSYIFLLPDDFMFRTYESCTLTGDAFSCDGGSREVAVIPVTQDQFWRISRNPFKWANKRKVLRLAYANNTTADDELDEVKYSELVSKYTISAYKLRYIKKPEPIILEDLSQYGLSIQGKTDAQPCKLHEHIHRKILVEAVNLAKSVWK